MNEPAPIYLADLSPVQRGELPAWLGWFTRFLWPDSDVRPVAEYARDALAAAHDLFDAGGVRALAERAGELSDTTRWPRPPHVRSEQEAEGLRRYHGDDFDLDSAIAREGAEVLALMGESWGIEVGPDGRPDWWTDDARGHVEWAALAYVDYFLSPRGLFQRISPYWRDYGNAAGRRTYLTPADEKPADREPHHPGIHRTPRLFQVLPEEEGNTKKQREKLSAISVALAASRRLEAPDWRERYQITGYPPGRKKYPDALKAELEAEFDVSPRTILGKLKDAEWPEHPRWFGSDPPEFPAVGAPPRVRSRP